ncbi:hypothetical protein GGTG_09900 [Gaeumannomyces tritici R3-111a-1]|uniref:Uncharacterized protein n=1 Tax=Gaeumannomyces tritici (strain R3-111a-1) TaxID=644352 RepID=J3P8R5_GAET3|nr:hypothetical protein GGTG_09900 [Gaeumannomyces tritici R3-111a-1]EJT73049.1 hypothetical protein GGTG_09900 [Gaeumannomyces tritici R3-111a-1]
MRRASFLFDFQALGELLPGARPFLIAGVFERCPVWNWELAKDFGVSILDDMAVPFCTRLRMLQNLTPADEAALDEYQLTSLNKLIFGSNLIEGAGAGVDITYKLCQLVFTGKDKEINDEDMLRTEEYDQRCKSLVTQDLPTK